MVNCSFSKHLHNFTESVHKGRLWSKGLNCMTNFPRIEKLIFLLILSHFYACDLRLPEPEEEEIDEQALEERLGRDIPSYEPQAEQKADADDPSEESCMGELSPIKSAYGQFVFTVVHTLVDPCHLSGFVVGLEEELQVKRSSEGFYFIDYLPAGKHDIIIELNADQSPQYKHEHLAMRIPNMVTVGGIRVKKEAIELPPAGQITGQAMLSGLGNHIGIKVYIPGTPYQGITSSDGSYRIEPFVPTGTHNLVFEMNGFHHGQVEGITVNSGIITPAFDIKLEVDNGEDGYLFLADGNEHYASRTVPISVGSREKARFMMISEDSLFQNASWQPVVSSSFFTFDSEGTKTLYLKFLYENDLESAVFDGSVTIVVPESQGDEAIKVGVWTQLSSENGPSARSEHAAVWTGEAVFVWGGLPSGVSNSLGDGFLFDPFANQGAGSWLMTSDAHAPEARHDFGAVWTGSEVFLWGGASDSDDDRHFLGTGSLYNPSSDSWSAVSTQNAPVARAGHITVMGDEQVLIWGGYAGSGTDSKELLTSGSIYDLLNDTWSPISELNAPSPREKAAGVWIGDKLMIWGGFDGSSSLMDGAIYDPASGAWTGVSSENAPSARHNHNMIWTGSLVLVWGGQSSDSGALASGALYNPVNGTWTEMSLENAPSARFLASGTWTGKELMVWGGRTEDASPYLNDGGLYSLESNSWTKLPAYESLLGRSNHGAVWTGQSVLIWGGMGLGSMLSDGAQYGIQAEEP